MRGQLFRGQHLNIRGAIKQNGFVSRLQFYPQYSRGLRLFAGINHAPDAVKLIMAVER